MKTAIYLRLSLLIPILVWGVCLLFFMIASTAPFNEFASAQSSTEPDWVMLFPAFYVFGIIIWIFPYSFLALSLLILSFMMKARALIMIFALSPMGMTLLTIGVVDLFAIGIAGNGTMSSVGSTRNQDLINFNIMIFVFSLLWGYICVGIGFGVYKLLRHLRIIRDEGNTVSPLRSISQYG